MRGRLSRASAQRRRRLDGVDFLDDAAAQHDVGAAAGHVGGDGDAAGQAGLGDHLGFLGMLLGVQHLMRQLFLSSGAERNSLTSIEVVPTSTGWPR
jgi:hypothetical protein